MVPSVSMGSTDGRVVPQKTRPSHAVCGEVSKEGRTARERHMVSSKTEGMQAVSGETWTGVVGGARAPVGEK